MNKENAKTPEYSPVDKEVLSLLEDIAGASRVLTAPGDIEPYAHDETEDLRYTPEAVVKPASAEEISAIMTLCNERRIPVTPRGGGTGLSGGALPVRGGLVLSLERMNRIIEIDTANLMAVVEPGVITEVFQTALEEQDLFYPPDPASKGSCTLGGNLAECAGGPRALKYGVTGDYVRGLEAVLPSGQIIRTGGKLLKNATGYDLTRLITGSEGTLAIVTKIILKIIPRPRHRTTMLVPFPSLDHAAKALTNIYMNRIFPCAAEFMEQSAVEAAEKMLGRNFPCPAAPAMLLIDIDGDDETTVRSDAERAGEVCLESGAIDVLIAETAAKQENLWSLRRSIGEAVKKISAYREEDTVAPRASLPELIRIIKDIAARRRITTICYGHAGDGNIHCNIIKGALTEEEWKHNLPAAVEELHLAVAGLGGALSGEHGIGCLQKNNLPRSIGPAEIELMKGIKKVFDPNGILNPGKIFPD